MTHVLSERNLAAIWQSFREQQLARTLRQSGELECDDAVVRVVPNDERGVGEIAAVLIEDAGWTTR